MDKNVAFGSVTLFWLLFAVVGCIVSCWFEEGSVIRCCAIMTAVCCYLAWVVTFVMQLNPMIGPRASQKVIFGMMSYWQNSYIHDEPDP
ncbi:hypothetical protein KR054_002619 [Drosophila jambulina]|nr:hypothetical protein KR054_002619 [Drosophila jambulina]